MINLLVDLIPGVVDWGISAASGFTLFNFLTDLLIDILSKCTDIADLKSGILKPSTAWMVYQRSIKLEHPSKY